MLGHIAQHVPFPAEIFHELAGQFHRIPFHAMNAGYAQVFHLSEQMMETMAKFMKQRYDFIVGKQSGASLTITRRARKNYSSDMPPAPGCLARPALQFQLGGG